MPVQLSIDFEAGLTARFPSLEDCIHHAAYGYGKGVTALAAELDMGESELCKRLSAHHGDSEKEKRPLRVKDFVAIVEKTGDLSPIYWLLEKYVQDPKAKQAGAVQQIANILPMLIELVQQAQPVRAVK